MYEFQGFNRNPQISQYLEWNPKEYWKKSAQNGKDFRANIAKYYKYYKFSKFRIDLNW